MKLRKSGNHKSIPNSREIWCVRAPAPEDTQLAVTEVLPRLGELLHRLLAELIAVRKPRDDRWLCGEEVLGDKVHRRSGLSGPRRHVEDGAMRLPCKAFPDLMDRFALMVKQPVPHSYDLVCFTSKRWFICGNRNSEEGEECLLLNAPLPDRESLQGLERTGRWTPEKIAKLDGFCLRKHLEEARPRSLVTKKVYWGLHRVEQVAKIG